MKEIKPLFTTSKNESEEDFELRKLVNSHITDHIINKVLCKN